MKLELKEIGGTSTRRWTLERGRRTLGRSGDCDWQVEDPSCAVSKLHCTIERDRNGFFLRDESANGTRVDGRNLVEGETERLGDGTRIEMGGRAFSVSISGVPDQDMEDPDADLQLSDEPVTISAILADVAPGGHTAGGILGGRDAGEWPPVSKRGIGRSSRDVDIGWSGPPQTASDGSILPVDWNESVETDYGNQLEHGSATHLSVPVSTIRPSRQEAAPPPQTASEPETVTESAMARKAVAGEVSTPVVPVGTGRIAAVLDEVEMALRDLFGLLEIDPDGGLPADDAPFPGEGTDAASRLAAVLERQLRFNAAFQGLLSDLSQAIEPRVVAARVDAEPRKLPWRTDRSYWQAYRTNFRDGENDLALRDLMRKIMLRRLGLAEDESGGGSGKANEEG